MPGKILLCYSTRKETTYRHNIHETNTILLTADRASNFSPKAHTERNPKRLEVYQMYILLYDVKVIASRMQQHI